MARHSFVVFANATEGRDAEYNRWYDETHLPEVLAVDGLVAAQRFELAPSQLDDSCRHRYLTLYEIETDDLAATLEALAKAGAAMQMSDAIDLETAKSWVFTPITDRVTG